MGASISKQDHNTALLLCKDRIKYVKEAMDARYAMSAAHLSYLQSVRNLGTALRQFVEAETLTEPSKSPFRSSYASPSPSPLMELGSPFNGTPSPLEKTCANAGTTSVAMKVAINLNKTYFLKEEEEEETEDLDSSWDFFDEKSKSNPNKEEDKEPEFFTPNGKAHDMKNENAKGEIEKVEDFKSEKVKGEIRKEEDFITHRAKDLVSSMKEIEQRFIKAFESGHEVSRMLETRKIRLQITNENIGKSSSSLLLSPFLICCKAESTAQNEENMGKIITWNRSVSSQSSSSRNPLININNNNHNNMNSPSKKEICSENGSDFIEEFCMISGSHSSSLDRLFAWERKLHDELKASENIRKAYDQKRAQLRHRFAKDFDVRVIDKTRANVKDLHSQLMVAIQVVDSISKRISKIRDEELQPQLFELLQGLTRMWKAMLEMYHTQHITISLAYHTKDHAISATKDPQSSNRLRAELECFDSTFSNWIKHHKLYIESLNSWLQICILRPQEKPRGRIITFSPRRAIAPPIFVVLRDWSRGVSNVSSQEVLECVKKVCLELNGEESRLDGLKNGLGKVFEGKRKFCESLIRVYESVKEEGERAKEAYSRCQS